MKWIGALAPIVLVLAVVWLVAGGAGFPPGPGDAQLVQVLEIAPREVELGDRVSVVGEGFPPGRPARVTFSGALYRPGETALDGVALTVAAVVGSRGDVEILFDESVLAVFCGAGDKAIHTTFRGDVRVAFSAAIAAEPPVAGVLRQVVFDVRPSSGAADGREEGARTLSWLGLRATPVPSGLLVDAVTPAERAATAGIVAGDVLTSFDGVRVWSAADVVPVAGQREAAVGVRHAAQGGEATKILSVAGFRPVPATELLGATVVVLTGLALVLLFGTSRFRVPYAATFQRGLAHARTRVASGQGLHAILLATLPPAGATAAVDLLVYGLLLTMPFGQYLVASRLDVALLFVAATTALVAGALISAGSLGRGLQAAGHVAWQHVPAAIAMANVVVTTGSLRVHEIAYTQGGWPWQWVAFRTPSTWLAVFVFLGCSPVGVHASIRQGDPLAWLEVPPAGRRVGGSRSDAVVRAHRLLISGLASVLFLGGWDLPGVSPADQAARPWLEAAGALCLLLKVGAVATLLATASAAMPRVSMTERTRATAVLWLPLSLLALATTVAWAWWSPLRAEQTLVGYALVTASLLSLLALAQRVRHGVHAPGAAGQLNPFL